MDPLKNRVYDCSIYHLPHIKNRAGNITPITSDIDLPFFIRRVFYIYDIPGGEDRGGHAHYTLHQFIIAASGSFDVLLDDGLNKRTVNLNRPYVALHVVPGIWDQLSNFSSGAVCIVLSSDVYKEHDYIRNYDNFLNFKNNKS